MKLIVLRCSSARGLLLPLLFLVTTTLYSNSCLQPSCTLAYMYFLRKLWYTATTRKHHWIFKGYCLLLYVSGWRNRSCTKELHYYWPYQKNRAMAYSCCPEPTIFRCKAQWKGSTIGDFDFSPSNLCCTHRTILFFVSFCEVNMEDCGFRIL